jgi:hypothetical protein
MTDMKQIPPYSLWIGHAGDGRDLRRLFAEGIRARVELAAEEAPAPTPRDLIVCRFPLIDGADNDSTVLDLALSTVTSLLKQKVPSLVCCGAGHPRLPRVPLPWSPVRMWKTACARSCLITRQT